MRHICRGTRLEDAVFLFHGQKGTVTIFTTAKFGAQAAFMQAGEKQKATASHAASEDTAHTLGIVSSLLSNLASDSPARIRLLAKFVENSYEKPEKLLEIRDTARARLEATDKDIEEEKQVRISRKTMHAVY